MPPTASSAYLEELIRHESFVRSTLRGLLADEADVQDAVQETWLRLLRRPPGEVREPRAWLARMARNLALSTRRSQVRRVRRESERGAAPGHETPDESLARVETRQRVVATILALEEPYRSVVLLRYEQDLAVAEIAQRLGRSEATVRSQLSRAHAHLRERLDRDFGDRRLWAGLALPLAVRPVPGLALAAGFVVLVAGGGWLVSTIGTGSAVPAGTVPAMKAVAVSVQAPELARIPPEAAQSRQAVDAPDAANESSTPRVRPLPPAELLDRSHYDDYERATFSFEHGLRDDPGLELTRNDWDLLFQGGRFMAKTVADDHGLIADLGRVRPEAVSSLALERLPVAQAVAVTEGHTYFVWTLDRDTDLATLVHVIAHRPGRSCVLDWYSTDGSGRAQGSMRDGTGESLVELLVRLRWIARDRDGWLRTPRVVLQARNGAGGGNQHELHMNGRWTYLAELSPEPLELFSPISMKEPGRGYFEGGWIPDDSTFVVERVLYAGRAEGDSNGRGLFKVVVGGQEIVAVDAEAADKSVQGAWTGRIELQPGDETETFLAIANSSAGEAVLAGSFVPRTGPAGFSAPNAGFFVTQAPAAVEPAPGAMLTGPRVVLQARSGAGGGNPNRIDMRGRTSIYVDRIAEGPLDFGTPPRMADESTVYFEGGCLPQDQAFVVTAASWSGTSAGDSNGHGELRLVVAGEELVAEETSSATHRGQWSGRLRILPGEESRTYLEIANTSSGDVVLTGFFEGVDR